MVFSVLRTYSYKNTILSLINITDNVCRIEILIDDIGNNVMHWYDIVSGMEWIADEGKLFLTLQPYDIVWLEPYRD